MDKLVPSFYKRYGKYINEFRALPLALDGLKPVERRVLTSTFQIARDKLVKSFKIDGYCIGNFHPHGSCLTGDTKIKLLNGDDIAIQDLVDHEGYFWVYSCEKDGTIVPGKGHSARVMKEIKEICEIELDNNEIIKCTLDHKIMLRDGSYYEASKLKENDSIMPLYLRREDGYNWYLDNSKKIKGGEKVCKMVVRSLINEDIDELNKKENKYEVHHKDNIRKNDCPDNLQLLIKSEHASISGKNISIRTRKLIGSKINKLYNNNEKYRNSLLKGLEKGRQKMFSENSPIRGKIRDKNSKLISDYNRKQVEDKILKILKLLLENKLDINEENYEIKRKEFYNYPKWNKIIEKFNSVEDAIEEAKTYNHIIKSIKIIKLDKPIKVYDITVEKYNNFAISQGIFVHNSYGTLTQLVRQGFLDGQGNFGTNIGVESCPAAAMRYTEAKLSKYAYNLAFKLIKYVPWSEGEIINESEPEFLPTMFPFCLLGKEPSQGIGFGYRTHIPCFELGDLHKRLSWLLGIRKTKPTIKPITDCEITSSTKELEELLTKGKIAISVKGKYTIESTKNQAILHSWPPGRSFETLLKKFSKELESGDIGFEDLSSNDETKIMFAVLKQRNRDTIFKRFVKKLDEALKGSMSFEINIVNKNGNVELMSVDDMIVNTYKMYHSINSLMLKVERDNALHIMEELQALEKIRPHLLDEMKKGKIVDYDKAIKSISNKSKVDIKSVKELFSKFNINKLLTLNTDISGLQDRVKDFENKLKNLESFVLEQYEQIVKE